MSYSRYRQARTLVRRLCRLPGQDRADYRAKIARLRRHFERFNQDAAGLCQLLFSIRRADGPAEVPESFGVLGDFLLEPTIEGVEADEKERDRWRLQAFDLVAGLQSDPRIADRPVAGPLAEAIRRHAQAPRPPNAACLFERLHGLQPAHRLVLLKSAAEWVVARYQRGVENWVRRREEWEKERQEWERAHPSLTPAVRDRFTDIFKVLTDPDDDGPPGVRRRNPRICPCERLRQNKDNCVYAGEKGHGPLCCKYVDFTKDRKAKNPRFNDRHFYDNANIYVRFRAAGNPPRIALERLHKEQHRCKRWFQPAWQEYLRYMALNEQTVMGYGRLPHCLKIGGKTWENSDCEWNPHTNLCRQYKQALEGLDAETLQLEPLYREWRRDYLAGPRKPVFRYPSSRELPMPKVFGAGYYEVDFDRSILRLRLDDMRQGEWVEFGFTPWPRGYRPSRKEIRDKVASVHVHFVGTRGRVGFRFDVPHRQSRFACTQDELDELRSRAFPRAAQDQQFVDAARKRLLKSFCGDAERQLRILAVDLGETGAQAAVYRGREHEKDFPLPIVKLDRLYTAIPEVLEKDKQADKPPKFDAKTDPRGLRKEHVARHLERMSEGAKQLAERRQVTTTGPATLEEHDFRSLKRHVGWMIRDWARHNAAQVTAVAEQHRCDLIVFESLRGFRLPGYEQMYPQKKRRLAMFAFGRIRRKVVEKAVERGMRVVTVPYFLSSQFCSGCGHQQQNTGRWNKNKRQRRFECECGDAKAKRKPGRQRRPGRPTATDAVREPCSCTLMLDSDANAARVLARVFWGEITLPSPVGAKPPDRARPDAGG